MLKPYLSLCIVVSSCFPLVSGCGEKRPADLPRLYPAKLLVFQDGAPVPDVTVILKNKDGTKKYSCGGMTNENGVAELRTHGRYSGIPEGTYLVAFSKWEVVKSGGGVAYFNPIAPKLENFETSELIITVTPDGLSQRIVLPPYRRELTEAEMR